MSRRAAPSRKTDSGRMPPLDVATRDRLVREEMERHMQVLQRLMRAATVAEETAPLPTDLVPLAEAGKRAGVTKPTIRRWAYRYRIGHSARGFAVKVAGRWWASSSLFTAFIRSAP